VEIVKRRGRGRPRGDRKQPTSVVGVALGEEAAPECGFTSPPEVHLVESSVARLDPAAFLIPPPGFIPREIPSNSPGFEFLYFVWEETLERLKLPSKFVKAIVGQDSGYAFPRESSAGQKTWRMTTYFDREGYLFFTDGRQEFALFYKIEPGFLLTFHCRSAPRTSLLRSSTTLCVAIFIFLWRSSMHIHGLLIDTDLVKLKCGLLHRLLVDAHLDNLECRLLHHLLVDVDLVDLDLLMFQSHLIFLDSINLLLFGIYNRLFDVIDILCFFDSG
jgi:hypothetical protein